MNPACLPLFDCKYVLTGHTKAINSIKFSSDGSKLLSGADDALLIIWDLVNGSEEQKISVAFNGPISAVIWTPTPEICATNAFAFCAADGTLFTYKRFKNHYDYAFSTPAHDGPIDDMAFDSTFSRLATVGSGCVKIWELNKDFSVSNIITTGQRGSIARCVSFFNGGHDLCVSFLDSHEVIGYQVSPWMMRWSQQLLTRIGYSIVSSDGHSLVVTNLIDGIDMYSMPPGQPLRSFKHNISRNVSLTIASALNGSVIIVGSDDGYARVYDLKMGIMTSILQHGNAGSLVQIVDALSMGKSCILATGSSDADDIKIKIWAMKVAEAEEQPKQQPPPPHSKHWIIKYTFVIAVIFYVHKLLLTSPK